MRYLPQAVQSAVSKVDKVRTISKLDGGQPTVLLEDGSPALDNVTVFGLSDSEVAALGKGQEITVTCTGGSRIAMSTACRIAV